MFSKNSDGTIKKSVIKETYARVTLRPKRKSVDDESLKEISGSAQIKRAKKMNNILDHASMNDKDGKALLMAKMIDQEGEEFGANVEKKSKVMQQNKTWNPEQTSGLMTTTRGSEYMWRQSRTFFKNTLGFSPISSQKKIDLYRKKNHGREKRRLELPEEKYISKQTGEIKRNSKGNNSAACEESNIIYDKDGRK